MRCCASRSVSLVPRPIGSPGPGRSRRSMWSAASRRGWRKVNRHRANSWPSPAGAAIVAVPLLAFARAAPIQHHMTESAEPLVIARSRLLQPAGLDEGALEDAFRALMGPGIDFGDLYFQHTRRESWSVEDGRVKDGAHAIEQGVGVRAICGEKTGFAYSDEIDATALLSASNAARAIARAGDAHAPRALVA